LSFAEAVMREKERTDVLEGSDLEEIKPYSYLERGLYYQQLQRWLAKFDRSQILITLFEDFIADTRGEILRILSFLGVTHAQIPGNLARKENRATPENARIPEDVRQIMRQYFATDVRLLGGLLSRDLSGWLS